jgi:NADH:ubiquinone oxidoreductase subunit C
METRELVHRLEQTFGKDVKSAQDEGAFPNVLIQPSAVKAVLSYCIHDSEMRFDFLDCLTAIDTTQDFIVIYHLYSTTLNHRLNIKVAVERHSPSLPSVTGFWHAAEAYELEAAEMFGLVFDGHPNPRHLLLPDDWHGYPFRKDYVFPEEYHGVEHRRVPLRREHTRP